MDFGGVSGSGLLSGMAGVRVLLVDFWGRSGSLSRWGLPRNRLLSSRDELPPFLLSFPPENAL